MKNGSNFKGRFRMISAKSWSGMLSEIKYVSGRHSYSDVMVNVLVSVG